MPRISDAFACDRAVARALLRRFGQFADRFADCFSRQPQRAAAGQYLEALFIDSERKSMQAMHGWLSDPVSYQALQHFITDSPWETPPVWARLRAVVPVRRGILALDDTSCPKQDTHSVGVKRQYCGALGKIANCPGRGVDRAVRRPTGVAAQLRAVRSPASPRCRI